MSVHINCIERKSTTLSLNKELLKAGRAYAAEQGTSLNAFVREPLAKTVQNQDGIQRDRVLRMTETHAGNSQGKTWSREDLYDVELTPPRINSANEIQLAYKVSFWDTLIAATAQSARCLVLYSEDLNHDQTIQGVKIQNPFR